MACVKSQSEDKLDALQSLNRVHSRFGKCLQIAHYRHALEQGNIDFIEHYLKGELAIILDCVFQREVNSNGALTLNRTGIHDTLDAFLILHNDVANVDSSRQWDQQPVLVRNVQIVKQLEKVVPTVCVRLYVGKNPIKEPRAINVYFSFFESLFYPVGNGGWSLSILGTCFSTAPSQAYSTATLRLWMASPKRSAMTVLIFSASGAK